MKYQLLLSAIALGLTSSLSPAATLLSNAAGMNSLDNTNSGTVAFHPDTGQTGTPSGGRMGLMTFQLPDLGGLAIDSASLDIYFRSNGGAVTDDTADIWVYNTFSDQADLDGAGTGFSASDLSIPFATTGNDTDGTPNYTLIQRGLFTDATPDASVVSLNGTGEANLTSFLQSNYTVGDYVAFAFVYDDESGGTGFSDRYFFGNTTEGGAPLSSNELSIVTVPEPATTVLVLAGLGTVLLGRRRRLARAAS